MKSFCRKFRTTLFSNLKTYWGAVRKARMVPRKKTILIIVARLFASLSAVRQNMWTDSNSCTIFDARAHASTDAFTVGIFSLHVGKNPAIKNVKLSEFKLLPYAYLNFFQK